MRLPHILLLEHTSTSFRKLYHSILIYGMLCLILYSLVTAAKTGILLNGTEGVIRTWYNKKDREALADYNLLLKEVEMGAQGADERLTLLKGSMSNTAQAAVKAANGGVVALDKLNKGFNWAALGAAALNAAVNFGISVVLSVAVSLISDLIHRVERAHQATADVIAKYNDEQAAIESATKSLDENYNKLGELRQLQNSDKWSDELRDQYEQLKLQTVELERQLEIAKLQAGISQQDVADALRNEVSKTTSSLYVYNPLVGESTKRQAKGFFDYVAIAGSFLGLNDNGLLDYGTQEEYTQGAIDKIAELNKEYEKGGKLVDEQAKEYQALASFLSSILTQYQGWIEQAGDNPLLQPDVDAWKNVVNAIRQVLNPDLVGFNPALDLTGYVKGNIEHLQNGGPNKLYQDIWSGIQGKSKIDILSDVDSQSYQWILKQAQEARVSVEAYVDELVKLGYVTNDITDDNEEFAASLLSIAKTANNDLEAAAEAFEALESAVSDYNDAGYITDDTLQAINDRLPGVLELLMDENGQLTDNAAAAMGSTDSLIKFIRAQLQAQLEAARTNYQNLVNELNRVKAAADGSAASMAAVFAAQANLALAGEGVQDAQDALNNFNKYAESGAFTSKGRSGGGGGSKSIYSKEYEQITDLTEHYIKMSEMRQKRMNEESSEYKAESRQQFLYYQQLAEQTYAEISRLRAKGYTEANADFRKLLQNYESYLGSMYSIAKAIWEQEKQERMEAVQDQIDAENDRWEAREKQLNHEKDYYKALLELEQKYLDTIGDIHTEIRDLDKELAMAKVYPEGTNLDLFTDEEHDRLVAQLRDIEKEATNLYTKYQEKLSSVAADNTYELSHITDEFQRQYEILLKQYEISKADLAVARARRELENVFNERNVAMLVNGVWTWVADPEAVKAAVEAVYEAEQTSEDALTDLFNTQRTQLLEETISNIELQRATEEAMHDKIIEGLQDQLEQIRKTKFCFEEFIKTLLEGADGVAAAIASLIASLAGFTGGGSKKGGTTTTTKPRNDLKVYNRHSKRSKLGGMVVQPPLPDLVGARIRRGSSFATGGVVNFTGPAHLDGTQTDPEVIFNSADAAKLYHLVHTTPNLVDKLIGNVQAKFEAILPSGFKGSGNPSMTTDNSRKVYWNGNVLMEGQDADNFLTMLERVLPVV